MTDADELFKYREKGMSPGIEPRGIPQSKGEDEDTKLSMATSNCLFDRKEDKQLRAETEKPSQLVEMFNQKKPDHKFANFNQKSWCV